VLITYLVKWYEGESGLNDMFLFYDLKQFND